MKRFTSMLLAVGAVAAFTGSAFAGYTTIQTDGELGGGSGVSQDGPGYELPAVIANYYGGGALPNGPSPLTNITGNVNGTLTVTGGSAGTITLTRVQDTGGVSPIYLDGSNGPLGGGTANDSLWNSGTSTGETLKLTAIIASDSQTFGYQYVNSGNTALTGSATNLFNAATQGETASTSIALSPSSNFVWYDKPSNGDAYYSSDQYNAASGDSSVTSEDHEVTYQISNASGGGLNGAAASWLVCFEDTAFTQGSDEDYQDCVVEIDAYTVPLPASAWMGLVTLAGMGTLLALRRRSQMA